ncbi:arylesterase [Venatoribacter cucullus]|uniref:Arylesterase n=2 Tax=Venatoribacter cucullus TaxID=2661630 RepID=A0A9X7UYJ0_9GAMM|nr:arylesterase [Venatoribacter cucullus]
MMLSALPLLARAEPVILVVGDSISAGFGVPLQQGWVALLQRNVQQRQPQLQVINASSSGETTQGGLTRLPALLKQHQPDLTIIELGGNDGLRGTPIPVIRRNLERMVQLAQAAGSDVMLLGMQIPPNYGARYTELFSRSFTELAERFELPVVPFLLDGIATEPGLMQSDGIHPTAAAQPRMTALVEPLVQQWLQERQ